MDAYDPVLMDCNSFLLPVTNDSWQKYDKYSPVGYWRKL